MPWKFSGGLLCRLDHFRAVMAYSPSGVAGPGSVDPDDASHPFKEFTIPLASSEVRQLWVSG